MSEQLAERFVEALGRLEAARELEPLVELFAEGCEVGNVVSPEKFEGREGARQFWTKYRDTFGEVRSTFRNRIITDTRAALEWTTVGYTSGGAPVAYEGVSLLEIEGGLITRFRAYFNAEDLSRQILDGPEKRDAAGG
ncbi:MAG TPA: nuclear transport factor 2 family protein [Pyrinomonadaceae bacterium]|nr:nuclear transport factor 2 family protein [Pyrinomonadaceae bacterium]